MDDRNAAILTNHNNKIPTALLSLTTIWNLFTKLTQTELDVHYDDHYTLFATEPG